jgi:hypothetical protein
MNKKNITNHYIISLTTITNHYHDILVGGFNPSEQYISQLGLLFPIYGKIIQMFETTNHNIYIYIHNIEGKKEFENNQTSTMAKLDRDLSGGPSIPISPGPD